MVGRKGSMRGSSVAPPAGRQGGAATAESVSGVCPSFSGSGTKPERSKVRTQEELV